MGEGESENGSALIVWYDRGIPRLVVMVSRNPERDSPLYGGQGQGSRFHKHFSWASPCTLAGPELTEIPPPPMC